MEWGFDKEFIAKDCGINLASLETRLRRAEEKGAQWESKN
jgi:DNA-directed RNA polymerase specialized sigma24 family protein